MSGERNTTINSATMTIYVADNKESKMLEKLLEKLKEIMSIEEAILNIKVLERTNIPGKKETIKNDMYINTKKIRKFTYFHVSKEDCPKKEGSWAGCILFHEEERCMIIYIKLPFEMEKEHVQKYFKPLIDLNNKKLH